MEPNLALIYLGVFFIAEALFSSLYYGGLNPPQFLRVLRAVFGIALIGLGTRRLTMNKVPLYLGVALLCLISIVCGYILGVLFPWGAKVSP